MLKIKNLNCKFKITKFNELKISGPLGSKIFNLYNNNKLYTKKQLKIIFKLLNNYIKGVTIG